MICSKLFVFPLLLFLFFTTILSSPIPTSKPKRVSKASGHRCHFPDSNAVPFIALNETLIFHANETCQLFRTDSITLKDREGLEYRFLVEGKRTRIFTYICLMESGGECVMTKHRSEDGGKEEGCNVLESYMFKPSEYAIFIQFERRPRKFSDKEKEARWRRRRHGRSSHRIVAEVKLGKHGKRHTLCRNDD